MTLGEMTEADGHLDQSRNLDSKPGSLLVEMLALAEVFIL